MTSISTDIPPQADQDQARAALDAHVQAMAQWHFSPETGCPYWLDWAEKADWDPVREIKTFDDLAALQTNKPATSPAFPSTR